LPESGKCRRCGRRPATETFIVNTLRASIEIPVCRECYLGYEPKMTPQGLRWVKRRRFNHIYYIIWMVESRRLAELVGRLGRGALGRVAKLLSPIGLIPLFAAIALIAYSVVDRFIRLEYYISMAKLYMRLPPGYLTTGIPGIDPAVPLFRGWLALVIAFTVHELAHALVSTYDLGRPPRAIGLVLALGIPIGAYVKIDVGSSDKRAWRTLAAGTAANVAVAALALALFASTGMPSQYLDTPVALLLPPELLRLRGVFIHFDWMKSILFYIWLVNAWLAFGNSIPLFVTDGHHLLTCLLSRFMSEDKAFKASMNTSLVFTSIILVIMVFERIIVPLLG